MAKVSLRAYNREIEQLIDRGQVDEAVGHCRHILQTFPKHLETYRLLGKAYLESKKYNEAVDIFQRLLIAVPNDFVANVGMSIIRDEEGKLDEAIWFMERAFETQPSNAAIQGELQRLYGRRDGIQPPRIRMTRGALANMYVQGELYPQAISEIRSLLKEDPNRVDMQTLLARAAFKSGQKNDAAETASQIIRKYPYNLDANRVLVEILSAGDKAESAQIYRQRVSELDPYAAQVSGSIFLSNEVSDAAVNLERWGGEPAGAAWEPSRGIALPESKDAQPDWLRSGGFDQQPAPRPVPASPSPTPAPAIQTPPPPAPAPAVPTPEEEIPDFLRAAGWGTSTGVFDESKSAFAEEPAPTTGAIEQGEMPDWLKAMKPPEADQKAPAPAEPAPVGEMPDWFSQLETQAKSAPASSEVPDWLKPSAEEPAPAAPVSEGQPDWLSQFADKSIPAEPAPSSDLDWLKNVEEPQEPVSPLPSTSVSSGLGTSAQDQDDAFSWLENLAAKQGASEGLLTKPEERMEKEPDWIAQAKSQPPAPTPVTPEQPQPVADLGTSAQEQDDAFSWLENLAAKQGASEGLLTKPEERMEKEPDWIAQAKSQPPAPTPVTPEPAAEETASWLRGLDQPTEEPGGPDETAMWLKGLEEAETSKQSAAPLEPQAPDWLSGFGEEKQKEDLFSVYGVPPLPETKKPAPIPQPVEPEREKSLTDWLHSLDQQEVPPQPVAPQPAAEENLPAWLQGLEEEEKPAPISAPDEDLPPWLRGEAVSQELPPSEETPKVPTPTLPTDWQPVQAQEPEPQMPKPAPVKQEKPKKVKEPKEPAQPAPVPAYKEPVTIKRTGMLTMPVDPMLGLARADLSRSNIPGALEAYGKLVKKGRFLDEVIFDLREALYRYPVEVSIWQSLGDAYMRANRLQDALDAYTKAEELLR